MGFKLITGKMGGGKSYYGVHVCQKAWADGAIVHTNLAFKDDWLLANVAPDLYVPLSDDFTSWREQLRAGREGYENLLVIDEGAIMFNARDFSKAKDEKSDVFAFMVHARKLGLDIYFISQAAKNVDAQLRRMAENEIQCLATKRIPYVGPLIEGIFGEFRRYVCTPDGREVMESSWARLDPAIYNAYETEAMHGTNMGITRDVRRQKAQKKVMTPALWGMIAALIGLGLSAAWGAQRISGVLRKRLGNDEKTLAAETLPPPIAAAAAAVQPEPAEKQKPEDEAIMSACGRLFDGRFAIWLRDRGKVAIGSRFAGSVITAISPSGDDYKFLLADGRSIPVRKPYDSEQAKTWKTSTPWETKSPYSLPPALGLGQ